MKYEFNPNVLLPIVSNSKIASTKPNEFKWLLSIKIYTCIHYLDEENSTIEHAIITTIEKELKNLIEEECNVKYISSYYTTEYKVINWLLKCPEIDYSKAKPIIDAIKIRRDIEFSITLK